MKPLRILLDECVDRKLGRLLLGHNVSTVQKQGWSSLKNGQLLTEAQHEFDIFLTIDQSPIHQQNLSKFDIVVVVLKASSSDLEDLEKLVPSLLQRLDSPTLTNPIIIGG